MSIINKNLLKKFEYRFFKFSLVFLFSIFIFGYSPVSKKAYAINIYTIEDLDSIRNDLTGDHVLMNDLDFNDPASYSDSSPSNMALYTTGEGWDPIGTIGSGSWFVGTFDGNGYTISNLYINNTTDEYVGLFGYVLNIVSLISNLGVLNSDITATSTVGAIVGAIHGVVDNSYSTGYVRGFEVAGGLVGKVQNNGQVHDSYSTCSVSGVGVIGGLVGQNVEMIENSYSIGSVEGEGGSDYVGGLVGLCTGTVNNSYSTGFVTGLGHVGGLVGYAGGFDVVTNSFWDTETSGMDVSDGGTGKTMVEMMSISTFNDTENEGLDTPWDIIEIGNFDLEGPTTWYIDESNDYPRLFWEFEGYTPPEYPDEDSPVLGARTFHPDRRCHWEKPGNPTWMKLEPMVKDGVSGMYLTWTQYDADRINIKIDDGTGKYPWKIEKTSNDGNEFLPNVSSWQNIMIKPTNHCKEGDYSLAISQLAYPYGWYGQTGTTSSTDTLGYSTKSAVLGTSTESGETPSEETPMVPETGSSDILYLTTSLSIIGFSIYLVLNGKSRRFALRDFERKVSRGL